MTVKAIGEIAGQLTALAMVGTRFDIKLLEQADSGDDWTFKSVLMENCVITSAGPSNVTISGAPSATFSGFSLAAKADPKVFRYAWFIGRYAAIELGLRVFVTFDGRQRQLAAAAGLKPLTPRA